MSKKENNIPIKNIFYILCYAWDILEIKDEKKVGVDSFKDIGNLLAGIFSYLLDNLLLYGLAGDYVNLEEEISTVKGKIQLQQTISNVSQTRNKIVCSFDEYIKDNILNRIIKYTIINIVKNKSIEEKYRKKLKKQSVFFENISPVAPTKRVLESISFNRNNKIYNRIITVSIMFFDNTIPDEKGTSKRFKDFYRDEFMERVFERFLLNFYRTNLNRSQYEVNPSHISWKLNNNNSDWSDYFDIDYNIPNRRTDITIENKNDMIQIIMDAKYYHDIFVKAYRSDKETKIRTSHINQVRGYILDSVYDGSKYGILLYPKVNLDVSYGMVANIENSPIIYKTINLDQDWQTIHVDLLDLISRVESVNKKILHNTER